MSAERCDAGISVTTRRAARRALVASWLTAIALVTPSTSAEAQPPAMEPPDSLAPVRSPPARPKRVLVLYSLAPESPTSAVFLARLRTALRGELNGPLEFFEEFVDLDRFAARDRWHRFARFYADKYRNDPPDLIVAVGLVAMEFTLERLRAIMPSVPVVFSMVYADRVNATVLPPNVTGRTLRMTLGRSLTMALRLQPRANRVVAITGSSRIDSIALRDALADAAAEHPSIRVETWQGFAHDSLLRAVRGLSPRTIVFWVYFRRNSDGRTMTPIEALAEIARASRAPVYTYADATIGTGVVGGAMWRYEDEAVRTGRLAARLLRGSTGAYLPPVEEAPTAYIADWRQLQRLRLNEKLLIPGTEVRHRMPGLWERYRALILTMLAAVVLEAVLIGLLLVEQRRRRSAQSAIADQTRYEHMLAQLRTDAARYAPQATPGALADALGRIGRYAGAAEVVLVEHSPIVSRPPTSHHWHDPAAAQQSGGAAVGASPDANGAWLELSLVAGRRVGLLRLRRAGSDWAPQLLERLASAADVLAVAITRLAATQRADEAAQQTAHIGRVAMIGELASTISHELRQPLAAILINGETGKQLLARRYDPSALDCLFDDIIADTHRASGVIEHIRSLLRNEVPPHAMVDLNVICTEAVDLLRREASTRGIRLEVSLATRLAPVAGQSIELQQVVLNLLLNAFDAVMAGPDRSVTISTASADGYVRIIVRDSGPGLSKDAARYAFEPFFTTKTNGLGMGLAIVRSIVERHRGRIQLESGEHHGATCQVVLPALDAPIAEAATTQELAGAP